MAVKVSIIVPVYKVEKYIHRCMESLLSQTLEEIEIILVDDGSPDDCPELCDYFQRQDKRVKVIHKHNQGLGLARNSGLQVATGQYVAFVDSDDFVESEMYMNLYHEAIRADADVVFSNTVFDHGDSVFIRKDVETTTIFSTNDEVRKFVLDYVSPEPESTHDVKYMMSVWRSIYRTEIIRQNDLKFMSERDVVSEDMPFNIQFLTLSNKVIYVPEAYYHYCLNGASLSHSSSFEKNEKITDLLFTVERLLSSIMTEKEYILHFQRFVLFSLRKVICSDYHLCRESGKDWKNQFKKRVYQPIYREALENYPICRMPLKHRMLYGAIKHHRCMLVKFYCLMNRVL